MNKTIAYKKFNWGHGLIIAITIMCIGIIFLVYKATTYNYDMVLPNYYEEEIKFNDQAKASRNANELTRSIIITQEDKYLIIDFPPECLNKDISGFIQLYRPSNAEKDLIVPINFSKETIQAIPLSETIKGVYILKSEWLMDGKEFKVEKEFKII